MRRKQLDGLNSNCQRPRVRHTAGTWTTSAAQQRPGEPLRPLLAIPAWAARRWARCLPK